MNKDMKEYIFQIYNNPAGNDIVVTDAPTGLVPKNILAIINKTTGKPVHSPIAQVVNTVTYSGTTMTITLDSDAPSIEGDLLIKAYSDVDIATEATATDAKNNAQSAANAAAAVQTTVGQATDASAETTSSSLFAWVKKIRDYLYGIVTTNPYAKDSSVKDGNDTAISVAKDVQGKVGTSADTSSAATVFGQLKAIKNLVGECTLEQNQDGTDTYTLILDRMAIIQGETVEIL